MSWLDKVKKYIKKLNGLDRNEELFIIIPKEEVDGINKWLKNYVNTALTLLIVIFPSSNGPLKTSSVDLSNSGSSSKNNTP